MDVVTFTREFTSPVPAKKLFNSLILDYDNLVSKLMPQVIKSVETVQGNGGPGTIKKTTFTQGDEIKYVKHRTDAVDKEKMTYSYTLIEGGELGDKIESINYEFKLQEKPDDGGCNGTKVTKYYVKEGNKISEEEAKAGREKSWAVFKAVETYLLANPTAYA